MAAWKWILVAAVALVLAGLAGLGVHFRPDRAIRIATGAVAHIICSKTFVSGLDPQIVFAETLERPGFRRLRHVMNFRIDRNAGTVDASTLGFFRSHATFHEGFGCVEQLGANKPYLLRNDAMMSSPTRRAMDWIAEFREGRTWSTDSGSVGSGRVAQSVPGTVAEADGAENSHEAMRMNSDMATNQAAVHTQSIHSTIGAP